MHRDDTRIELLRIILENTLQPRRLDAHPWTKSLIVLQACEDTPDLLGKSPGQQLVTAIARLFKTMMPATPPRQGKRLDTRWGEFGILAAQYFAPLIYGEPLPASLRDAWGYIDRSIVLFVFEKPEMGVSEPEKEAYKLVGNELLVAPNSTLSDWHRNGLRRYLDVVAARERYLAETLSKPAVIEVGDSQTGQDLQANEDKASRQRAKNRTKKVLVFGLLFLVLLLAGLGTLGGLKARQLYQMALQVRQDAVEMQALVKASGTPIERLRSMGGSLSKIKQDYETLKTEAEPFLWMAPWFKWVPNYGGDIASVQSLIGVADPLLSSANLTYQAASPLLDDNDLAGLTPTDLSRFLVQAQPQLIEAHRQIDLAAAARGQVPVRKLSPDVKNLLVNNVDPLLALMQNGLTLAENFPAMVGAGAEGPKTYLLLVENEDELRPTGGFLTAAGTLLMQDGQIASMTFENTGDLDDWTKPYPAAPWQLQKYMNSNVLVLRDTNWFTNYPTAAAYAERLYSYVHDHSVDGVFAFDQHLLVELLDATGPVDLEGVSYPIDSGNVIAYMRTAKIPTSEDLSSPDWTYKLFMQKIADALAERIFSGKVPLERLITFLFKALNEHHILVQLDNPSLTSLMAEYHWDGAVRPEAGDFLMVVDSNVGFNKTNAMVKSSLDYDIDLTSPLSPIGSLIVNHTNNSPELICKQWDKIRPPSEDKYPISDCYWNYLRVYLPKGAKLVDSVTQSVPAYWTILKKDVPAHVDDLDEGIENVSAFGTLQVVPGSESLTTSFRFALPPGIMIQPGPNQFVYHLRVQKQPGTLAVPITLRLHLPGNSVIQKVPSGAVMQDQSILYQSTLATDLIFEVEFQLP